MGLWTDLATYRGPTPNQGGAMVAQQGVVLHIAEGSFEGTIAWQKNPAASVSSHFVVDYDGRIAQMVDTDRTAWTQAAGNGRWLSIENAGFHTDHFTDAQVTAAAKIFARGHQEYGYPLQLANSPSERGLGYHAMGGVAWGNHPLCPGAANIALRQTILNQAIQIVNGTSPSIPGDDVAAILVQDNTGIAILWTGAAGLIYQNIVTPDMAARWNQAGVPGPFAVTSIAAYGTSNTAAQKAYYDQLQKIADTIDGGTGGGASPADIAKTVLDQMSTRLES